jgi:hypothetical protein
VGDDRAGKGRHHGVSLRALSQRCEVKLADLGLDLPVPTIEDFLQALGAQRGRRVELCPVDIPIGMCGLVVETVYGDVFVYERRTTPLHRAVLLGHEAGHYVFGHRSAQVTRELLAWLTGLDVRLVQRVWARGPTYTTEEERTAEVFGTLVAQRAVRPVVPAQHPADPEVAEVLARLRAALGEPTTQ